MLPLGADQNSFVGTAAQYAVMKELLLRGCHVAIPEPDYGTDIIVLREDREDLARLQVKSAVLGEYKEGGGFWTTFAIGKKQFNREDEPKLYYVFVPRDETEFREFLIVPRGTLQKLKDVPEPITLTPDGPNYKLTIQFRDRVRCGKADLTDYRNAWALLPPVQTSTPIVVAQPPASAG